MSIDHNVYVGSFLQIEKKELEKEVEVFICPRCGAQLSTAFCPNDGEKVISKMVSDVSTFDIMNWFIEDEKLEDKYYMLGDEEFIGLWGNFAASLEGEAFISNDNLPKKATEEDFKEIIEILKKNNIKYELHYGVKLYYS